MQITCPSCHAQLRIPDEAAAKKLRCPKCAATFQGQAGAEQIQVQPPLVRDRSMQEPPLPCDLQVDEELTDDREDAKEKDAYGEPSDNDTEARQRGQAAALWFVLAGVVTLVMIALNIGLNLYIKGSQAAIGSMFGCGVVGIIGAVCHFVAGRSLKTFHVKGRVTFGIVFGFIFAVLFGIDTVTNVINVPGIRRGTLQAIVWLYILLGAAAAFCNLFAAINGIMTINNPAVTKRFGRLDSFGES